MSRPTGLLAGLVLCLPCLFAHTHAAPPTPAELRSPLFWLSRALAEVNSLPELQGRLQAMGYLAMLQARAGDLAGMRKTLARIKESEHAITDPRVRFSLALDLIQAYAVAGDDADFAETLQLLRELRDRQKNQSADYLVIVKLCDAGRFAQAVTWANASPGDRAWYLSKIAAAQAKAGRIKDCQATLDLSESQVRQAPDTKPEAAVDSWENLASAAAEAGLADRAARYASKLPPGEQALVYATLAQRAWRVQDRRGYERAIREALQCAARCKPTDLTSGYAAITRAQAMARDGKGVAATEATVPRGRDPSRESIRLEQFYYEMAQAYAILGEEAKVAQRLRQARDAASAADARGKELHDAIGEARALLAPPYPTLITALAAKGKIDAASKLAAEAPPPQRRAAIGALAVAYASLGRDANALAILSQEKTPEARMMLIGPIGEALARAGALDRWLAYAQSLASPLERGQAYTAAAKGLLERSTGNGPRTTDN